MFSAAKFFNIGFSEANMHGFNCAYLGVDKNNPYPLGSNDYKQFELGWNEGIDLLNETNSVPSTYPYSNEYNTEDLS